jgi:nucleoid-associated protein YgaU
MATLGAHDCCANGLNTEAAARSPRHQCRLAAFLLGSCAMLCLLFWSKAGNTADPGSSASHEPSELAASGIQDGRSEAGSDGQPPPSPRSASETQGIAAEGKDYRALFQEEAEASVPTISGAISGDRTRTAPKPGSGSVSTPAVHAANRVDSIKSAVRDALNAMPSDRVKGIDAEDAQPPLGLSADKRRERLRELVEATPVPEELVDEDYLTELQKEVSMTLVTREADSSEQVLERRSTDETPAESRTYRVQPGDSLWKIAESVFGDGNQWSAIYLANRDDLKDADVLSVGQRLIIPQQ